MTGKLKAVCKKRAPSDAVISSDPTQEGDHHKRRRNRTTLSCLNCHTSRRMCDRKRPCGRCTQLGLTGLCIYEVDDPNQQSGAQGESLRLRQRVAELEGVVRELKNKPHPRWAKSQSSPSEELEKPYAFSESHTSFRDSSRDSQQRPDKLQYAPSTTNSNVDTSKDFRETQTPGSTIGTVQADYQSLLPPPTTDLETLWTLSSSPPSDPFTQSFVATKVEYPQFPVWMASDQQLTGDIDIASLMPRSDLLNYNEVPGNADWIHRMTTHSQLLEGHCGCLNETGSYNAILELSLRLRKTMGILSHSTNHRFSTGMLGCPLSQQIAELDTFATTVLGGIMTWPNDTEPMNLRSRTNTTLIPPAFS